MINYFLRGLIMSLGILCAVGVFFFIGPTVESKVLPVLTDFEVTSERRHGSAITIMGTVRKSRPCQYIHPWRAITLHTGRPLRVEISDVDIPNWAANNMIQFSPIVIYGAGNEPIMLWAEHQCHPLWHIFSPLGVVNKEAK